MARLDRRVFVAGLTSLGVTQPAMAEDAQASPIAHGVLAGNYIAQQFEVPKVARFPSVYLWGPDGKKPLSDYLAGLKGKTILMTLWAEWCTPCMIELPDFARLQEKFGNDKFAIVPVLTATRKNMNPDILRTVFNAMRSGVFTPLIENMLGATLFETMSRRGNQIALPCNLLIGPDGSVAARMIGTMRSTDDTDPAKTYVDAVNRTSSGAIQSRWGQQDGEDFAKAMADGFLSA